MATVTKDFKVKNGIKVQGDANIDGSLYIAGTNAVVNGSDIITDSIITGGTQTNISVTYDSGSRTLNFIAENGIADSTTDDLLEGQNNLYFTDARARGAISVDSAGPLTYAPTIGQFDLALSSNSGLQVNPVEAALELENVAQSVGTFGSTTLIPSITVDGKGRITNVTVNDVATNLSISSDSGTDTVDLLNDTLTFAGGQAISTGIIDNQVSVSLNIGTGLQLNQGTDSVEINDAIVATVSGQQELQNKTLKDATLGNDLTAASHKITDLAEPANPQDAATKNYVDSAVSGLNWKEAVNLLADSNVDISGTPVWVAIDGHSTPSETYRILLTAQTDDSENGIWTYDPVIQVWTRALDADTYQELLGAAVFVMEGTQYGSTSWVQSNHYLDNFVSQSWTQFSGQGTYTAGFGINLVGNEFSADTTEMATSEALGLAVSDLTGYVDGFLNSNDGTVIEYIDTQDAATLLAANTYSDDLVATGNATATPQYLAINVNDVAKQVAATVGAFATLPTVAYSFATTEYRSAEFLVKVAYGTHTEISKVILTLDTSDNIAITEYAIVGTNGSLSTISADIISGNVALSVTPVSDASVTVVGTLLV